MQQTEQHRGGGGGGRSSSSSRSSGGGSGRGVTRLPPLPADVTRCGLRRTQPGNQK